MSDSSVGHTVYHLALGSAWRQALQVGVYRGSPQDWGDGFLHFSTADQVAESAARHRARVADLLLLWVRAARLGAALRWERSRGGQLFPHLYGPLPVAAVHRVDELPLGPDGRHVFPTLE